MTTKKQLKQKLNKFQWKRGIINNALKYNKRSQTKTKFDIFLTKKKRSFNMLTKQERKIAASERSSSSRLDLARVG